MAKQSQMLVWGLGVCWSAVSMAVTDVNSADVQTLAQQLNGVGVEKAAAIVSYRDQHGPFKRIEDLTNVKGIGPAILEKNRDELVVSEGQAQQ